MLSNLATHDFLKAQQSYYHTSIKLGKLIKNDDSYEHSSADSRAKLIEVLLSHEDAYPKLITRSSLTMPYRNLSFNANATVELQSDLQKPRELGAQPIEELTGLARRIAHQSYRSSAAALELSCEVRAQGFDVVLIYRKSTLEQVVLIDGNAYADITHLAFAIEGIPQFLASNAYIGDGYYAEILGRVFVDFTKGSVKAAIRDEGSIEAYLSKTLKAQTTDEARGKGLKMHASDILVLQSHLSAIAHRKHSMKLKTLADLGFMTNALNKTIYCSGAIEQSISVLYSLYELNNWNVDDAVIRIDSEVIRSSYEFSHLGIRWGMRLPAPGWKSAWSKTSNLIKRLSNEELVQGDAELEVQLQKERALNEARRGANAVCPHCSNSLYVSDEDFTVTCTAGQSCERLPVNEFLRFFNSRNFSIAGVGPALLRNLYRAGWLRTYADLWKVPRHEILKYAHSITRKYTGSEIFSAISQTRNLSIDKLLMAIGVMPGKRWTALSGHYESLGELLDDLASQAIRQKQLAPLVHLRELEKQLTKRAATINALICVGITTKAPQSQDKPLHNVKFRIYGKHGVLGRKKHINDCLINRWGAEHYMSTGKVLDVVIYAPDEVNAPSQVMGRLKEMGCSFVSLDQTLQAIASDDPTVFIEAFNARNQKRKELA